MSARFGELDDARTRALLHDLRQYVSAGSMLSELGADETPVLPVQDRMARVSRIFTLLQEMIDSQLKQQRGIQVIDLGGLVEGCVRVLPPALEARVALRRLARSEVCGDPVQLRRAVGNMLDNALRAAGSAGSVAVMVGQVGSMAYVEVTDDGAGFGRVPSGDGQGLTVVASAVHNLHGQLDISSGPGIGTRVRVSFPLHEESGVA